MKIENHGKLLINNNGRSFWILIYDKKQPDLTNLFWVSTITGNSRIIRVRNANLSELRLYSKGVLEQNE